MIWPDPNEVEFDGLYWRLTSMQVLRVAMAHRRRGFWFGYVVGVVATTAAFVIVQLLL